MEKIVINQIQNSKYINAANVLINTKLNVQLKHWATPTSSLAEHEALGDLYDSLDSITDRFVECTQGTLEEILEGLNFGPLHKGNSLIIVKEAYNKLSSIRPSIKESHLGQIIDDALEALTKAIYKLKFITT